MADPYASSFETAPLAPVKGDPYAKSFAPANDPYAEDFGEAPRAIPRTPARGWNDPVEMQPLPIRPDLPFTEPEGKYGTSPVDLAVRAAAPVRAIVQRGENIGNELINRSPVALALEHGAEVLGAPIAKGYEQIGKLPEVVTGTEHPFAEFAGDEVGQIAAGMIPRPSWVTNPVNLALVGAGAADARVQAARAPKPVELQGGIDVPQEPNPNARAIVESTPPAKHWTVAAREEFDARQATAENKARFQKEHITAQRAVADTYALAAKESSLPRLDEASERRIQILAERRQARMDQPTEQAPTPKEPGAEPVKPILPSPGEAAAASYPTVDPAYVTDHVRALVDPNALHDPGNALFLKGRDRIFPMSEAGLGHLQHALMDARGQEAVHIDMADSLVAPAMKGAGAVEGTPESSLLSRAIREREAAAGTEETQYSKPLTAEEKAKIADPKMNAALSGLRSGYDYIRQELNKNLGINLEEKDFYEPRVFLNKVGAGLHLSAEDLVQRLKDQGIEDPGYLKERTQDAPTQPYLDDAAKIWSWYNRATAKLMARRAPLTMLDEQIAAIKGVPSEIETGKVKYEGGWLKDKNIPDAKKAELVKVLGLLEEVKKQEIKAPTWFEGAAGITAQEFGKAVRAGIDAATKRGGVAGAVGQRVQGIREWADQLASGGTPGAAPAARKIGGAVRGYTAMGRFGLSVPAWKLHMLGKITKMEAFLGPLRVAKAMRSAMTMTMSEELASAMKEAGVDREAGAGAMEGIDLSSKSKFGKMMNGAYDVSMVHLKYTEAALNRVAFDAAYQQAGESGLTGHARVLAAKDLYSRAVSRYNPSAEPLIFRGEGFKQGFQGMRSSTRQAGSLLLDTTTRQKLNLAAMLGASWYVRYALLQEEGGKALASTAHQAFPFKPKGLVPTVGSIAMHPSGSGVKRLVEGTLSGPVGAVMNAGTSIRDLMARDESQP